MKVHLIRKFICFIFILIIQLSNAFGQKIQSIEVRRDDPEGIVLGISDCEECGVLLFETFIKDLKFSSQMHHIKSQNQIVEKNSNGPDKYKYRLVVEAIENQLIEIQGPLIADYNLQVLNLTKAGFHRYIIDLKTETPVETGKGSLVILSNPKDVLFEIDGFPDFRPRTPYTLKDYRALDYHLLFSRDRYQNKDTIVHIRAGKTDSLFIHLLSVYGDLKFPRFRTSYSVSTGLKSFTVARDTTLEFLPGTLQMKFWIDKASADTTLLIGSGNKYLFPVDFLSRKFPYTPPPPRKKSHVVLLLSSIAFTGMVLYLQNSVKDAHTKYISGDPNAESLRIKGEQYQKYMPFAYGSAGFSMIFYLSKKVKKKK